MGLVAGPVPLSIDTAGATAASLFYTSGISTSIDGLSIKNFINAAGNALGGSLGGTKPAVTSFSVLVDGQSFPVASVQYGPACQDSCYMMDLTLVSPIYTGAVITVSYVAPSPDAATTNAAIQSPTGADAVSFGPLSVTNNVVGPNAPSTPTVEAGVESATITVATSGSPSPTSYLVTASPGGATCTVTGASGSCTITGLTAGTAYTFTAVGKRNGMADSKQSPASTAISALGKAGSSSGSTASWDVEPATDSETDAFTEGFWPSAIPGNIIITNEFGFTVDKKNGIKPKIRMKTYAGKIKMTISATYEDGAKTKKYKCTYAPFGSTKKAKTAKWKWYTPKKACILPTPLVTALKAGTTTLSAKGKWTRLWATTGTKSRVDKTKVKPRTLKYTVRAKPAAAK
jgi:hypothetical protein